MPIIVEFHGVGLVPSVASGLSFAKKGSPVWCQEALETRLG